MNCIAALGRLDAAQASSFLGWTWEQCGHCSASTEFLESCKSLPWRWRIFDLFRRRTTTVAWRFTVSHVYTHFSISFIFLGALSFLLRLPKTVMVGCMNGRILPPFVKGGRLMKFLVRYWRFHLFLFKGEVLVSVHVYSVMVRTNRMA
jgi:hypothetical protein